MRAQLPSMSLLLAVISIACYFKPVNPCTDISQDLIVLQPYDSRHTGRQLNAHGDGNGDESWRRELQDTNTTTWEPIRIQPVYGNLTSAGSELEEYIVKTLMPSAISWFSQALSVHPVVGNLTFQRSCKFSNLDDTCREYYDQSCLDIPYPDSIFPTGELVCPTQGDCEALDGGGYETDFVLLVNADHTAACEGSPIAYATPCQVHSEGRPLLGAMNICPTKMDPAEENFQGDLSIVMHEMIHSLVFASILYPSFRDEEGNVRSVVTEDVTDEGGEVLYSQIVTDNVVAKAREHFDCNTLTGVPLENEGSSDGTAGAHWERKYLMNDIMTGSDMHHSVVSDITLALFHDSGWYQVSYEMAQHLVWGAQYGCSLFTTDCLPVINGELTISNEEYYCAQDADFQCRLDRTTYGVCAVLTAEESDMFQYLGLKGLDALADGCPYYQTLDGSDCTVAENGDLDPTFVIKTLQQYGKASRCFESTLVESGLFFNRDEGCYKTRCNRATDGSATLEVQLGATWRECPNGASVTVEGYTGTLVCPPDAAIICNNHCGENACSSHGMCNPTGVCDCFDGYYGDDCLGINCEYPCVNGECDFVTGLCTCEPGWEGVDCSTDIECPNECSGHGTCDEFTGLCACTDDYTDDDCSILVSETMVSAISPRKVGADAILAFDFDGLGYNDDLAIAFHNAPGCDWWTRIVPAYNVTSKDTLIPAPFGSSGTFHLCVARIGNRVDVPQTNPEVVVKVVVGASEQSIRKIEPQVVDELEDASFTFSGIQVSSTTYIALITGHNCTNTTSQVVVAKAESNPLTTESHHLFNDNAIDDSEPVIVLSICYSTNNMDDWYLQGAVTVGLLGNKPDQLEAVSPYSFGVEAQDMYVNFTGVVPSAFTTIGLVLLDEPTTPSVEVTPTTESTNSTSTSNSTTTTTTTTTTTSSTSLLQLYDASVCELCSSTVGGSCQALDMEESNVLMIPPMPTAGSYGICLSVNGGDEWTLQQLSTLTVIPAATPFDITAIEPPVAGVGLTSFIVTGIEPSGSTIVAFAPEDQCADSLERIGETRVETSNNVTVPTLVQVGEYHICLSVDNGASWVQQELTLLVEVQASTTSLTRVSPTIVGTDTAPNITFSGLQPSGLTAFALTGDDSCLESGFRLTTQMNDTQWVQLDLNGLSSGIYQICYTVDGETWYMQENVKLRVLERLLTIFIPMMALVTPVFLILLRECILRRRLKNNYTKI